MSEYNLYLVWLGSARLTTLLSGYVSVGNTEIEDAVSKQQTESEREVRTIELYRISRFKQTLAINFRRKRLQLLVSLKP